MKDLASAATNFRQKLCKLSLTSAKLESICKIKVSKYEIVFKVLLLLFTAVRRIFLPGGGANELRGTINYI